MRQAAVAVGAGKVAFELLEEAHACLSEAEAGSGLEAREEVGALCYASLYQTVLQWAMAAGPESGSGRAGLVPALLELRPRAMRPFEALNLLREILAGAETIEASSSGTSGSGTSGQTAPEQEERPRPARWRVESFRPFLLGLAA